MSSTTIPSGALAPTLENVLAQKSLKWIFVGGKGGVGKTTTSCSVGIQLAKVRRNVLIVSTDPAHNLSDAFGQKFSRSPIKVEGFNNLFCMEIDPTVESDDAPALAGGPEESGMMAGISTFLKDISSNIPGIDEAMSFAELMKHVQRMEFDVTVFDTAPTGHTLRLLALPGMIDKALAKVMSLRERFGPMMSSVSAMMGGAMPGMPSEDQLMGKLDELKGVIDAVQERIHDPDSTTFICVCIPEFLSLYETERLVQELSKFEIDTHNIVVNQVLFPNSTGAAHCSRCNARSSMQKKYMEQIGDLYEDFHVVTTPLLNEEIRGPPKLKAFSEFLIRPYSSKTVMPAILEKGSE